MFAVRLQRRGAALLALSQKTVAVGRPPRTLLERLDLKIEEGERWAVLGANGTGKSTLAQVLVDQLPAKAAELISFEAHRSLVLAELKEFRESRFEVNHKRATVASFLFPELYPLDPAFPLGYDGYRPERTRLAPMPVPYDAEGDHPLLKELEEAACSGEAKRLLQRLNLLELRHCPIFGLSTGQLRKLMLLESLLRPPRLLILDEALDGLDKESRLAAAEELAALQASTLVLITHRMQDLLLTPSHALVIEGGGAFRLGDWAKMERAAEAATAMEVLTVQTLPSEERQEAKEGEPIVEFRNVTINYASSPPVLKGLDWTVKEGENWAVLGPNGSGKSTLIELVSGENPLAFLQDISLFGRRKGSGESVWEIKRQLGVISHASHMDYVNFADPGNNWYAKSHSRVSTWEVVCSGFFDSVGLYQEVQGSQRDIALDWVRRFQLQDLVFPPSKEEPGLDFFQLSFGQQKLVLLCRAMVKRPRLLLLDEPSHGLSGPLRARLLGMLDLLARDSTVALVHVTHRRDEIAALGFSKILRLGQEEGEKT